MTEPFQTYETFPPELYRRFIDRYVLHNGINFSTCLDLGCGSGGLIKELDVLYRCQFIGVDVSELSIDRCRAHPGLQKQNIQFVQDDVMNLIHREEWKNRFDLIVSYSTLHIAPGDTPNKFRLLKFLSKPGAILAIDAQPRMWWNISFFSLLKFLFKIKLGSFAIRFLSPIIAPNMPKSYIRELSKCDYIGRFKFSNFIDLSYFDTPEFKSTFKILKFEIVRQDGFLSGRKSRFTLLRL